MKNITIFFLAFFLLAFFNANGQQGGQTPVGGLSYAPDSNYVIYSQFYKGRNGVAMWVHKDSINWIEGFTPKKIIFVGSNGTLTESPVINYSEDEIWLGDSATIAQEANLFQSGQNLAAAQTFGGNRYFTSRYGSFGSAHSVFSPFSTSDIPSISFWKGMGTPTSPTKPTNNSDLSQISGIIRNSTLNRFEEIGRIVHVYDSLSVSSTNRGVGRIDIRLANNSSPQFSSTTRFSIMSNGRIAASLYSPSTNDYSIITPTRVFYPGTNGVFYAAPLDSFTVINPAGGLGTLRQALTSIYSAATTGVNFYNSDGSLTADRTLTGASNSLAFTGMGNMTATGAGSATYRLNLYPNSSLPVLVEQTSAGDTAKVQLQGSLGRATILATEDIYLQAATGIYAETLEGSSTGIVSVRPNGKVIRREEAFFNAYFTTDTFIVAVSETDVGATFTDAISPSFTVSGSEITYTGTDTAYFDLSYSGEVEFLESVTGTYTLELSCYKNGSKIIPSESWHRVYYVTSVTEPILSVSKRFFTQLVNGDVLAIRQNGTTGIDAALHNFSFTATKTQ